MKTPVLLKIIGTQRVEDQTDKIELTTMGTLEQKDGRVIFEYTENGESGTEAVQAVLTVEQAGRVRMERKGAYDSCLMLEKQKRHLCHYATPYGELMMGIFTRKIELDMLEHQGRLYFDYTIDVNGALASENEVNITFQEAGNVCQN